MKDTDNVQYQKANFLIFLLCFIPGTVLSTLAMFFLFPNLNGIGSICISATCGIPLAFSLFFVLQEFKVSDIKVYLFPSLIFPLISILLIGYSFYEQRPENIFRVFIVDPIPAGVTNIRAYDISAGIDQEIVIAFDATPDIIDQIIQEHNLKLDENPHALKSDIPFEYFPEVDSGQDWTLYRRAELENINWWSLWVNTDKTTAIFQFIDG